MSFSDLGLSPDTLKAVEDAGYSTPTPIQEQAIPYVLMGRDVLGIAQTGTGKTAGFTLPMIDILAHGRAKARMPRSLILAPTRELANQVAENFTKYGKYQKLNMALLIGGESMNEQKKVLEKGVDVLIATPGRLLDLFERGNILLRDVKILVIDEADRMLDMGFIPDVERIVGLLPPLRQTLFFSATMDKQIQRLADAFLSNPKEVRVSAPKSSAETVTQKMVVVDDADKRKALRHILRLEDVRNAFIFCNRKRDVSTLHRSLTQHGFDAAQLHGDMPQNERTATLARFKAGEVRLLVCSDVAARGIDIADVSHVFNFDVPIHAEDYVHRIGRTGRAGREGIAYTIATPADIKHVSAVESQIGKPIERFDLEGIESQELSEDAAKRARRGRREPAAAGSPAGGGRSRTGRPDRGERRDRPRTEDAPLPAEPTAALEPEPEPEPLPQPPQPAPASDVPAEPTPMAQPDPAPARRDRPQPQREPKQDARNSRRPGKGRSGGKGRRGHPAWDVDEMQHPDDVIAFGDHTPAFLLVSTAEAALRSGLSDEAEAEAERIDEEVTESVGTGVPAQPVEAVQPVPTEDKPKRRRSRRRKPADEACAAPASPDATTEQAEPARDTVDAIDQAEAPAAPASETDTAPKKRSPRRRAARKAEPAETEEPAAEAETKPADATATAPANEDAEGPKPRTTRRRAPRKTTTAAEQTAQPEAEVEASAQAEPEAAPAEDAAPVKKPRKTPVRKAAPRKKAAAEAPAESDEAVVKTADAADTDKPKRKAPARKAPVRKAPAKAAADKKPTARSRKKPAAPPEAEPDQPTSPPDEASDQS